MTEIKQCWAFHRDGTRCDMPAGHPGNHATERTWTDAECHDPSTEPPAIAPLPPYIPPAAPPPPAPPANDKCVACQHRHRGRECPGACECKEFIG